MKIKSKICAICQVTKCDRYVSIDSSTKDKKQKHERKFEQNLRIFKLQKKPRTPKKLKVQKKIKLQKNFKVPKHLKYKSLSHIR